jgi:hypothetical protein
MNRLPFLQRRHDRPLLSIKELRRDPGDQSAEAMLALADTDDEDREAVTEILLQELYEHVALDLAAQFRELKRHVDEEIDHLVKLAESLDLEIGDPAAFRQPTDPDIDRLAWKQVARVTVLHLLDWLVVKRRDNLVDLREWAEQTMTETVKLDRFERLTSLPEQDIGPAMRAAAQAVVSWPKLARGLPLRYLGWYVTLSSVASEGVLCVVSDVPQIAFIPLETEDEIAETDDGEWLNVTPAGAEVSIYPLVRRLDVRRSQDELELSPQIAGVSLPADYAIPVRFAGESAPSPDTDALTLTSSDERGAAFSVPADGAHRVPGGVVLERNIRDHVE